MGPTEVGSVQGDVGDVPASCSTNAPAPMPARLRSGHPAASASGHRTGGPAAWLADKRVMARPDAVPRHPAIPPGHPALVSADAEREGVVFWGSVDEASGEPGPGDQP